jgi:flagellar M-ring protein FliF
MGSIKRLSLALVVNNKQIVDSKGKISYRALNDAEKQEISDLAKQAMGFSEARGDTISVVNSTFINPAKEVIPELPVWKNPEYINLAKDLLKFSIGLLVLFMLYRKAVKPMVLKLTRPESNTRLGNEGSMSASENNSELSPSPKKGYKENLEEAKLLAQTNPKAVASIVTSWANSNE